MRRLKTAGLLVAVVGVTLAAVYVLYVPRIIEHKRQLDAGDAAYDAHLKEMRQEEEVNAFFADNKGKRITCPICRGLTRDGTLRPLPPSNDAAAAAQYWAASCEHLTQESDLAETIREQTIDDLKRKEEKQYKKIYGAAGMPYP